MAAPRKSGLETCKTRCSAPIIFIGHSIVDRQRGRQDTAASLICDLDHDIHDLAISFHVRDQHTLQLLGREIQTQGTAAVAGRA